MNEAISPFASRTAALLGTAGVKKLENAHVAVFGVGGVGSFAIEALARAGVGSLSIFDHDTVSDSNRNRQLIALTSTVGRKKVEVMAERIRDINPAAQVFPHPVFYDAETAPQFPLEQYDYILDAIDSVTSKLLLIAAANQAGVPILSSMGTGNKLDPSRFVITDIYKTSVCPLARVMRQECKKRGIPALRVLYSTEPPLPHRYELAVDAGRRQTPGSVSFVPSVAGLLLAGEIVTSLSHDEAP